MTSNRVLSYYEVDRVGEGEVEIKVSTDSSTERVGLSVADLQNLLTFAQTGREPEETEGERASREGRKDYAAFLDSLLLTDEERKRREEGNR